MTMIQREYVSTSYIPQALQRYREEKLAFGLGAQGTQSTRRKPDGLEMSMCPLQSVAVLGAPRDDKVLIPMSKINIDMTTYTQKLSNIVMARMKACLDITRNGGWTGELNFRSSCSKHLT